MVTSNLNVKHIILKYIELFNIEYLMKVSENMQNFQGDEHTVIEKMIKVEAEQRWNDTGIDLYPDSFVTITYKGGFCKINDSERLLSAADHRLKRSVSRNIPYEFPPGCLIGKVEERIFHIGQGKVVHHQSGRLYLSINRIISSLGFCQLARVNGYYNVKITVMPFALI
ncbi:hypothetical protein [Enterococcus columbae]|uniref:Uncharacterized protein n=1 Tax=Enterococcus columbae DSM 7374 = ATCC 51263 TaxID=1121865 RepID=S1MV36_9ENTE|nr:hypothetical protein [Enterococcus columbae]EOT41022.1 hypothetical protein OMW_01264 [Enterococcus columbae DSM 7374 = ATCC 51263]EOW80702.1 hypothetical protein I568_01880 [Enterococcus columbae DSM 7374 = ATCC 51263]OJG21351.1 hypothetical protein RR47_GL001413 [Enterococcus columbae DSM 7374 = ATCC 51263]